MRRRDVLIGSLTAATMPSTVQAAADPHRAWLEEYGRLLDRMVFDPRRADVQSDLDRCYWLIKKTAETPAKTCDGAKAHLDLIRELKFDDLSDDRPVDVAFRTAMDSLSNFLDRLSAGADR